MYMYMDIVLCLKTCKNVHNAVIFVLCLVVSLMITCTYTCISVFDFMSTCTCITQLLY